MYIIKYNSHAIRIIPGIFIILFLFNITVLLNGSIISVADGINGDIITSTPGDAEKTMRYICRLKLKKNMTE